MSEKMKLNTLTKLNIEDKLYRYDFFKNGIFEYKVVGIREYPEGIFYEVECKNCTDILLSTIIIIAFIILVKRNMNDSSKSI